MSEEKPFTMPLSKFMSMVNPETPKGRFDKNNFNFGGHTADYYEKEYSGFSKEVYELIAKASHNPVKVVDMTDRTIKKCPDIE